MKQLIESLVDDLDGSEAQNTLKFAVSRVRYEIDLSDDNFRRFYENIGPFMEAARRVGRESDNTTPTEDVWVSPVAVRRWAKLTGFQVPQRGDVGTPAKLAFLRAWLDGQVPK
ncbi:Lsr2 family protein [Nonomuraea jabiensis]|uniref:histone-like nucleoid-structuring protein Lsr2 n=1 Tax=Nonomuraea jabiensis TaxID=882448 RepID=UPI00344AB0B3